jgi:hypothetical integral membrane protein (TIGR02206 family)
MIPSVFSVAITGEPFHLFSPSHLLALLITAGLGAGLFLSRDRWREPAANRWSRHLLAWGLLFTEVCFQLWHVWTGSWDAAYALPLQLCSVSLIFSVIMLLTKSYPLYEITFFTGLAGAGHALLTPELFYPFPHFRFLHFFMAHAGIVLACLYMTWVEQYRPTFRSVWKTMAFLNLLLLIVLPVNRLTGGNYMFVSRKPDNPSLIDFLGPYPWYVLSLEAVALLLFVLLYLPFAFGRPKPAAASPDVP